MSQLKPSLREYSSMGDDFIRLSNAIEKDKGISKPTKKMFSEIADAYSDAILKASKNRRGTYGDAHKAWQEDNVGPLVLATTQAKELLNNPSVLNKVKHIVANEKGPEIGRIRSQKFLNHAKSMIQNEKASPRRNPGAHAQSSSPLISTRAKQRMAMGDA